MALYSEKVMDHFRNPRNLGKMEDADGIGEVGNAKCGDIMRMYIKVDSDTQVISDVKFNTFGCGSAIATSSMATELIKGKTIDQALTLSNQAVVEALDGLPAQKITAPSWQRRRYGPPSGIIMEESDIPMGRSCVSARATATAADTATDKRRTAPMRERSFWSQGSS